MRILLDTHVFLWFISGEPRLPRSLREAIQDSDNTVFLSPVSVWEATVKHQLGKLPLPDAPGTIFLFKENDTGSGACLSMRRASDTWPPFPLCIAIPLIACSSAKPFTTV